VNSAAGGLRSIKARKLAGDFPGATSLRWLANAAKLGVTHPENKNADSSADHHTDFPAPHRYRGHRAKIRYFAGVPVRRRLE
jgi:hypothetical protein